MSNDNAILGIDIGGTGLKFAIVDTATGEMTTERFKQPTPKPATPQAVAEVVGEWIERLEWKGPVGCGLPSIVQHGLARSAANIDDAWKGLDVQDYFSERFGMPFTVVNDADAAGIAEMAFGTGKGRDGLVMMLTIGTGIGSAMFHNGHLVPNTELGHLKFRKSIAEKYCSNSARKRDDMNWEKWGKYFNEYLHHLERLFSPDLFILGGGLSKKFHAYQAYFDNDAEVIPAEMQNAAGVIGAAMAAKYKMEKLSVESGIKGNITSES